ncbi:MAG: trypsin-like peptidase domain-containing protein [Bdellovibrionales bacterium]|nr:trypsin-like peptidase domain-containing protein [Bdellovibrionales bacterium]
MARSTLKRLITPFLLTAAAFASGALVAGALLPQGERFPGAAPVAYGSTANPVGTNIMVALAKKAVPSVVNIYTLTELKGVPGGRGQNDMFRFFEEFFRNHGGRGGEEGGEEGEEEEQTPFGGRPGNNVRSLGSGFIVDSDGLILTNNHVIQGADEVKVKFTEDPDEEGVDGEVVGQDPELDLALVRVKTKRKLEPLPLGDSNSIDVGEYVIAVGNPFGQGHSVTHGIISAKDRMAPGLFAKYLQTDAPINPGNSGGPLVNMEGKVIGINNAIDARAQGIGFAIPINAVKKVLPELKTRGKVARGYIGVLVEPLRPEIAAHIGAPKGMKSPFVSEVVPGLPADKAGVKPYDVILEFDGKKIRTPAELIGAVIEVPVGKTVPLKLLRSGKEETVQIEVMERPVTEAAQRPKPEKAPPKGGVDTGMTLEELNDDLARRLGVKEDLKGVVVAQLAYGSPAAEAGLRVDDIILEVDRKAVASPKAFFDIVKEKKSYLIRVMRLGPQDEFYKVIVLDLTPKK